MMPSPFSILHCGMPKYSRKDMVTSKNEDGGIDEIDNEDGER